MSSITRGSFKGEAALVLENEFLRAVILPEWGAKTVSLVHRASGTETLWQNPSPTFTRTGYGDPYGNGEFAGFDEMFPTISRCFYESAPWAGSEVPDHGEVWSIPWESAEGFDHVTLTVNGVRFPYRLQKTVSLQEDKLHARYTAESLSDHPLDFIWAAHPLFNAVQGMKFIVPRGMRRIINAVPGPVLGGYGGKFEFPAARRDDGQTIRLDLVPPRNDTGYQKYWFEQKVTEGWCILHDPGGRLSIGMSFPPEQVPWLGMWLNEGGFAGQYNIAPEPATAAMDRIDFSKMWDRGSLLKPGEKREWHLTITVAEGGEPSAMTAGGDFVR
jgi:galactose mutarotase-like enzyme